MNKELYQLQDKVINDIESLVDALEDLHRGLVELNDEMEKNNG